MSEGRRKRVGVVGSDINHALEYASIFRPEPGSDEPMLTVAPLNPMMEAELAQVRSLPVETAQPWARSELEADPDVAACEIVGWWGQDERRTAEMAGRLDVPVVHDLEDLVAEVDAVLVCTYRASDHYELTMPFLEAGRDVFVDKPFTDRIDQSQAMIDAAVEHECVLFSSSPWKWAPCVTALIQRLPELGAVHSAVATGPIVEDRYFYTPHTLELLQLVMGGSPSSVAATWTPTNYALTLHYADGRVGFVNGLRDVAWVRHLSVYGERGYLETEITNEQRDAGKVQMMVEFARALTRRRPPLPQQWCHDVVGMMVGADRSADHGGQLVELEGT